MPERPATLRGLLVSLLRHAPAEELRAAQAHALTTPSTDAYAELALLIESACEEALRVRASRRGE